MLDRNGLMGLSKKILVLVFDGLGAKYIDPYGQSDFRHDSINALAAESTVFENLIAASVDRESVVQSMFGLDRSDADSIFSTARELGLHSEVIVDDESLYNVYRTDDMDNVTLCEQLPCNDVAETFEQTELVRTFAQVIDFIGRSDADLIVVHINSLANTWDAPIRDRMAGVGQDDPDPLRFHQPPIANANWRDDPDQFFQWQLAYQSQVRILDECVGVLLAQFDSMHPNSMIVFTATGGYALGEHGYVGSEPAAPWIENMHLPLIVRVPGVGTESTRVRQLISPANIVTMLKSWWNDPPQSNYLHQFFAPDKAQFDCIISQGIDRALAIRTDSWSYVFDNNSGALFVRPDDMWEMSNVVDRCPAVAEAMMEIATTRSNGMQIEPLPAEIFEPVE
jgi:arylsulfatase A-like enzyme